MLEAPARICSNRLLQSYAFGGDVAVAVEFDAVHLAVTQGFWHLREAGNLSPKL